MTPGWPGTASLFPTLTIVSRSELAQPLASMEPCQLPRPASSRQWRDQRPSHRRGHASGRHRGALAAAIGDRRPTSRSPGSSWSGRRCSRYGTGFREVDRAGPEGGTGFVLCDPGSTTIGVRWCARGGATPPSTRSPEAATVVSNVLTAGADHAAQAVHATPAVTMVAGA